MVPAILPEMLAYGSQMNATLQEIGEDDSVCLCVTAACIYLLCLDSQKKKIEKEKKKAFASNLYFPERKPKETNKIRGERYKQQHTN